MALTVSGLTCHRSGRRILDGLDLALDAGEIVLLRGPNGAGKSTLLRALAGLLPITGRIALDGAPLGSEAYGEALAYAGHLDAIKPQLGVAENLAFWAALFGGDAGPAMEAFDLHPLAERPAHTCSAGQKRRLGLARLLIAPRRLWLLDEPTVSLDAAAIAALVAALRAHAGRGGIALIATHVALDLDASSLALAPAGTAQAAAATDPFLAGSWA